MEAISRREMLRLAGIASGGVLLAGVPARAEDAKTSTLGPANPPLDAENKDSAFVPPTDHGNVETFKYPFAFAHKKTSEAGWARQVTVKDLPISTTLAGVNMRLLPNGCRELHWHESGEWAFMLAGKARITCVDYDGKAFVDDVGPGDLWYFPSGIPHSIQGHPPDGCEFLLVFDDGNFNEYETFLISEWVARTPKSVLAKDFGVEESALANLPKEEQFIFFAAPFGDLEEERKEAAGSLGYSPISFSYKLSEKKPTKTTKSGSATITDTSVFPISKTVASALVTVKPGGMRELHWHPNADEWQYYIKGQGRMTVYTAGNRARTMDFQASDVGYVPSNAPHYIENTGDSDLVFLELFKSDHYQDLSLSEWITHTPAALVMSHLHIDRAAYDAIPREKEVIVPA
jgi:oxalate decarboxylase